MRVQLEAARAFAAAITSVGCRLALDDFGVGFGSFIYLRSLPLSYIKIDTSFVQRAGGSADDRRVVKTIVGIAREFDLETIAEGVEDEETLAPAGGDGRRLRPGLPPRPTGAAVGATRLNGDRQRFFFFFFFATTKVVVSVVLLPAVSVATIVSR